MNKEIFLKIFKYAYHDTKINKISTKNNDLLLHFDEGIYSIDEDGKEIGKTSSVIIGFNIDSRVCDNPLECLSATIVNDKKKYYLDGEDVLIFIKKRTLDIYNLYYSRFNSTILIDASLDDFLVLIEISNCSDLYYSFS